MSRLRLLVIAAILASTVAFVIGAAVERGEPGSAERPTAHREGLGGERDHEGLLRRSVLVLVVVLVVMLAFAALDIRELVHQLHEARGGLAALAAVVAVLHLIAAGAAALRGSPDVAA
jgi:hypothetical protein